MSSYETYGQHGPYDGRRFGSKQTQDVANWGYIILYLVVILGSLIGNGLFLFTIKKNQHLRRSHHFLLSSLYIGNYNALTQKSTSYNFEAQPCISAT